MDGINIPNSYPDPIKKIHKELEMINFKNFPNATTDLLRTYLEKIIKSYADISSKKIPNKNNQGFVQLDACLIWLESEFKAGPKKGYIQSINKLRGIKNNSFVESKEHLDALNHNFSDKCRPSRRYIYLGYNERNCERDISIVSETILLKRKRSFVSPLRLSWRLRGYYPSYLQEVIRVNGLTACRYVEPYGGGAGAGRYPYLCLV